MKLCRVVETIEAKGVIEGDDVRAYAKIERVRERRRQFDSSPKCATAECDGQRCKWPERSQAFWGVAYRGFGRTFDA